jgi:signal transduction histidine kinase
MTGIPLDRGTEGGRRLAMDLVLVGAIVALVVLVIIGTVLGAWQDDPGLATVNLLWIVGYGGLGWLLARRLPLNPIGWLLLASGLGVLCFDLATALAEALLSTDRGTSAGGVLAWIGQWQAAATLLVPLILLLFPTGILPSPRWRVVAWGIGVSIVLLMAAQGITPGPIDVSTEFQPENPFGIEGIDALRSAMTWIGGVGILACSILALVGLVRRYRTSRGDERQQLRWLAFVGSIAAALLLFVLGGQAVSDAMGAETDGADTVGSILFLLFAFLLAVGVPAAIAIALLRYRLYDLDLVVRKAVMFTTVVIVIVILYAAVALLVPVAVLGVGPDTSSALLLIASGVLVGVLVGPVRNRARRFADRVVYGRRATPYEVLADFSERLADTYSIDDVLPRMVQLVIAGTGAAEARVWLRDGRELRAVASGPEAVGSVGPLAMPGDHLPPVDAPAAVFPIRHQGELIGAITLVLPANDPMDTEKERLVTDLAGQAGLVLRNVRLIEELRASRRRIVTAQDARAKTLERNIHDGAQQQLVALAVQLRLLEGLAERDPARARAMAAELQVAANGALEDLRDLARGIYPPLLADQGLVAALEAQARKAVVPTVVRVNDVGRYTPETEATVYFCVLEALNNVAKYARATSATVSLSASNADLRFSVADDGVGFDPDATGYGTGLQGMSDRLDAVGGRLEIRSARGSGTTVSGSIAVEPAEASP